MHYRHRTARSVVRPSDPVTIYTVHPVGVTGFEPASLSVPNRARYQTAPHSVVSPRVDSNHRPHPSEGCALPLRHGEIGGARDSNPPVWKTRGRSTPLVSGLLPIAAVGPQRAPGGTRTPDLSGVNRLRWPLRYRCLLADEEGLFGQAAVRYLLSVTLHHLGAGRIPSEVQAVGHGHVLTRPRTARASRARPRPCAAPCPGGQDATAPREAVRPILPASGQPSRCCSSSTRRWSSPT